MENKRQRTVAENVAVSAHQSSRLFYYTSKKGEKKSCSSECATRREKKEKKIRLAFFLIPQSRDRKNPHWEKMLIIF